MGKVARQMVEQAGIDVNVLLDKLVRAASAEFTTFYYYTILRVNAIGFDGEGLKEIIEDARIEDRNHFEALTPRIYELGGALPRDIRGFADVAGCPDAYLPADPRDMKAMLNVLVEAERCAVRTYTDICNYTCGKDHRTYDLALAILHEEVEHEAWFSEYLAEGPSGHFRRGAPGTSPYVRRFMSADIAQWSVGFQKLACAEEIPPGRTKLVRARAGPVILANWAGVIYALQGLCPHQDNSLEGALVWDYLLDCPWHHFQYDVRSGENHYPRNVYPEDMLRLESQVQPLRTFPVEVREGEVWVDLG